MRMIYSNGEIGTDGLVCKLVNSGGANVGDGRGARWCCNNTGAVDVVVDIDSCVYVWPHRP